MMLMGDDMTSLKASLFLRGLQQAECRAPQHYTPELVSQRYCCSMSFPGSSVPRSQNRDLAHPATATSYPFLRNGLSQPTPTKCDAARVREYSSSDGAKDKPGDVGDVGDTAGAHVGDNAEVENLDKEPEAD